MVWKQMLGVTQNHSIIYENGYKRSQHCNTKF